MRHTCTTQPAPCTSRCAPCLDGGGVPGGQFAPHVLVRCHRPVILLQSADGGACVRDGEAARGLTWPPPLELEAKVRTSRGLLRDYEPSCGPLFQALTTTPASVLRPELSVA